MLNYLTTCPLFVLRFNPGCRNIIYVILYICSTTSLAFALSTKEPRCTKKKNSPRQQKGVFSHSICNSIRVPLIPSDAPVLLAKQVSALQKRCLVNQPHRFLCSIDFIDTIHWAVRVPLQHWPLLRKLVSNPQDCLKQAPPPRESTEQGPTRKQETARSQYDHEPHKPAQLPRD